MKTYGLIGKSLIHSFSKKYFAEKFEKEGIRHARYHLFELSSISQLPKLIQDQTPDLSGLNVTIPYKKAVIPYLDELDPHAAAIGAVNTIQFLPDGKLKGYNTDYIGFKNALKSWDLHHKKALVLGTGGASHAIKQALMDIHLPIQIVSRRASEGAISYAWLKEKSHVYMPDYALIVNTTPLGTFPDVANKPDIPYSLLTPSHLLFDLVYHPSVTAFMKQGIHKQCQVKNGYDMLVGQAEAAWHIWQAISS